MRKRSIFYYFIINLGLSQGFGQNIHSNHSENWIQIQLYEKMKTALRGILEEASYHAKRSLKEHPATLEMQLLHAEENLGSNLREMKKN